MKKVKILLIIPAFNESDGITKVIEKVKKYCAESVYNIDYLVINDGSNPSSFKIFARLATKEEEPPPN